MISLKWNREPVNSTILVAKTEFFVSVSHKITFFLLTGGFPSFYLFVHSVFVKSEDSKQ